MRCPFCNSEETQVKDSRPTEDHSSIRRRRACGSCGGRFTTFERVQLRDIIVLKSGDKREGFDRDKITRSMQIALSKRDVDSDQIEKAVSGIVRQLESLGDQEIKASQIGALVMNALVQLDIVGYIRYASVYKDFRKPEDFNAFVEELKSFQPDAEQAEAAE